MRKLQARDIQGLNGGLVCEHIVGEGGEIRVVPDQPGPCENRKMVTDLDITHSVSAMMLPCARE